MLNPAELRLLATAVAKLSEGFDTLPDFVPGLDEEKAASVLELAATRMRDNYPYHHPQYAGQMLKPPHPVARIAYAMSMWINPNNHALDGGRASSAMEKECIEMLGGMFGLEQPLGHLAGGGTMANLEALWVASRLHPGKKIVASSQAHYTHSRLSDVLGAPFSAIAADAGGRMSLTDLERILASNEVGTIVATMGTTGLGTVDPLPGILELAGRYGARVHADAAYGGYFTLAGALDADTRAAFDALPAVDSIVVDPHKHGLQPYGCGCVLFRDAGVGQIYRHDSPYTYFTSAELHLGEISLECSRPGAAAVALWTTMQLLPLETGGEFATDLDRCLQAGRGLYERLCSSKAYQPLLPPPLDIVVFVPRADDSAAASAKTRRIFELAAADGLHLAMIELPFEFVTAHYPEMARTGDTVTCLRSVLMKPEHVDWLDRIMTILERAASAAAE